jgi:hypothetical protein
MTSRAIEEMNKLPDVSRELLQSMKELDTFQAQLSRKLDEEVLETLKNCNSQPDAQRKRVLLRRIIDEISEKKISLAVRNYDLIDHHMKILDKEVAYVEEVLRQRQGPVAEPPVETVSTHNRSKKRALQTAAPSTYLIDPNEPVYCYCRRVAFGEMIACDNEDCSVEWFHYPCVGLTKKPKNDWLCPDCSRKKKKGL